MGTHGTTCNRAVVRRRRSRDAPRLGGDPCRPSFRIPTILADALPRAAYVHCFSDQPASALFPIEAASVLNAGAERRREFATVRHCARKALQKLGLPGVAIPKDADGVPRWPTGVVGSMTHCLGYRAAAVARSCELRAVGIDAEPHAAVSGEVLDFILADEERMQFQALAAERPELHWGRIAFCAKEAFYKAWFPLTRRWLDFADVAIAVHIDGTFEARVDPQTFHGRWVVDHGLVVAATAVPVAPAPGSSIHSRNVRVGTV